MDNETPPEGRKPNGQFAKGVNGRMLASDFTNKPSRAAQLQDLYDTNAQKVLKILLALIEDPKTPATAKVSAVKEFNDRHLGRPAQTTAVKIGENEFSEIDLSKLSDAELRKVVEAARKGE